MHAARAVAYSKVVLRQVQRPTGQLGTSALARVQVLQGRIIRDHRELGPSQVLVELLDPKEEGKALPFAAAKAALSASAATTGVGHHVQLGVRLELLQDSGEGLRGEVRGEGEGPVWDRQTEHGLCHQFAPEGIEGLLLRVTPGPRCILRQQLEEGPGQSSKAPDELPIVAHQPQEGAQMTTSLGRHQAADGSHLVVIRVELALADSMPQEGHAGQTTEQLVSASLESAQDERRQDGIQAGGSRGMVRTTTAHVINEGTCVR